MKSRAAVLIVAFLITPIQARIITVDPHGSADFHSIQAAINDANEADEIIVEPGTYEENIRIDKDIILRSTDPNDPEVVADTRIVNATLSDSTVYFAGGESPACILSGFTITNDGEWNTVEFGGGINGNGTLATIEHNIITENNLRHEGFPYCTIGGGLFDCDGTLRYNIISENQIYCDLEGISQGAGLYGCDGDIYQNIICNNSGVGFDFTVGGGLCSCNGTIWNNTIFGNDAHFGAGISLCLGTIKNCIVWGDNGTQIYASPNVTYSNIEGSYAGTGNINVDPCFADPANNDFHLKSAAGRWHPDSQTWVQDVNTSLCIDAGNPGCPVGDEPNPNGNRINMGAYGGTAEAGKSPFMCAFLVDLTNDRKVDANDLRVFVDYWLDSGPCIPADFDRSQTVDSADFALLANSWMHSAGAEPTIDYMVGECTIEATASESGQTRFSVSAQGNYIHFEDMMIANCCPDELRIEMTIEGTLIIIREVEQTTEPCRCICDFPVAAMLGPLEPATYTIDVYQNELFIGTETVTVLPP